MHIYYATRGLRGRPYHSYMINTDLFAFFREKNAHHPLRRNVARCQRLSQMRY